MMKPAAPVLASLAVAACTPGDIYARDTYGDLPAVTREYDGETVEIRDVPDKRRMMLQGRGIFGVMAADDLRDAGAAYLARARPSCTITDGEFLETTVRTGGSELVYTC